MGELQCSKTIVFDEWPFGFGKMSAEQRRVSKKDLSPSGYLDEAGAQGEEWQACLLAKADGAPRRKGALPGSVVCAINGAQHPTAEEIQAKADRLSPQSEKVEVLLMRPLPLPARAQGLNKYALTTRQSGTGAPSGRMSGKHFKFQA